MPSKSESLAFLNQQFDLLHESASQNPEATIPSCPDWTSKDLVIHLDLVYRFVTGVLDGHHESRPTPLPEGVDPFEAISKHAALLFGGLAELSEDSDTWNWRADPSPNWWLRRMCHETLIHRVDAELGAPGPLTVIDPDWASDGLDEAFVTFFGAPRMNWKAPPGSSVHIHSTNAQGEWLLVNTGEDVTVTREHTKADLAVKGTSQDLLLFVFGRGSESALEVFGDEEMLKTLRELSI